MTKNDPYFDAEILGMLNTKRGMEKTLSFQARYGTSSASTMGTSTLTLSDLMDKVVRVKELLDKVEDPIKQFMLKHGFNPEKGDLLVLPESLREECGPFPSKYVRFSDSVLQPVMVKAMFPMTPHSNPDDWKYTHGIHNTSK